MVKKQSYNISDSLIKYLIKSSNGFIKINLLEKLFSAIETEANNYHFTPSAEANLIRIISATFNRTLFLSELIKYPHHLEITIAIAASSNYLTDIAVRNPELLYNLFNQQYFKKEITPALLSKEISNINNKFQSFNSKANMLRNLKSKIMLAIGLRDIFGNSKLEETVQELSITASGILVSLFENCYRSVLTKHNIRNTKRKYSLASLGKLGGSELNYSSDVDLILFFDKNSRIGTKRNIEYFEILNETVQLFIKTASELTANGFLYRIDFRLRPDGKNAPLTRTIADYERYYETRGQDWERQMLIKLNFLCGSKELFDSFKNYISPYVYPHSFSSHPAEQIKKMKLNIEKQLSHGSNIKLFSGGIRDIEFSVQALQLIYGGKNKELQTGTTLTAVRKLRKYNFLSNDEAEKLTVAYIFYRRVEHFLQLLNNAQTHSIPEDVDIVLMLIKYLTIPSITSFKSLLRKHRENVRRIFNDITGNQTDTINKNNLNYEIFNNKQRAFINLRYLAEGTDLTGQKKFDNKTAELFGKLIPNLLRYLIKSKQPDIVLENFAKLISTTEIPSIIYRELLDGKFLKRVLTICEFSELSVDILKSHKEFTELLLSRFVFAKNIDAYFTELSAKKLLLILAVQYTLGLINNSKLSDVLSKYIKFKISEIAESFNLSSDYFIAGLGSFGSKSMGFKSDVDLIFVVRNFNNYETVQNKFQELLNNIKLELSIFEVDCSLRPEGNKSPLAWDLESYKEYFTDRARVWEFQSLLKIEIICGNSNLFSEFFSVFHHRIKTLDIGNVRTEMLAMIKSLRDKHNSIFLGTIDIKNGWGGLTYINFIISFLLIKNPDLIIKLSKKSLLEKITYFCRYGEQKELIKQLKINYVFLKNVELSLQNCLNKRNSILSTNENEIKLVADFLSINNVKQFISKIGKITKSNYEIFNIILDGTD